VSFLWPDPHSHKEFPVRLRTSLFACATALVAGSAILLSAPAQAQTISVNATIRDFTDAHEDFEELVGPRTGFDPGIVLSTLGVDGKPVYAGLAGNPTTSGAANFNQWYNTTPGVNIELSRTLVMSYNAGSGTYIYDNQSYFPIDNDGFGNGPVGPGIPDHNYLFTTEIALDFTLQANQSLTFTGDDDVWVFINDVLAIDLGGVHDTLSQTVDLNTFAAANNLTVGNDYSLKIFHAERHTTASTFRFETNILVRDNRIPEPGAGVLALVGVVGTVIAARRKRA
jgi:fibro-slime domain-containing protein